jgi:hypothetical protein
MTKIKIFAILIAFTSPVLSYAASMIESRDGQGHITKIYIQGDKARIQMPNSQGFAVMDVRNKTMQVVMHRQRMVMDMSSYMQGKSNASQPGKYVDSYLKTRGLGPKIAGYETEEQAIYVNNQYCGSVFVSVRAMNDLKLRPFAKALDDMGRQVQQNVTGMTGMQMNQVMDTCQQGEKILADQLFNIGFPMKSTYKNGRIESVITRLARNTKLPPNAFIIPKQYQVLTPTQMIQQSMRHMRQQSPMNVPNTRNDSQPLTREAIRRNLRKALTPNTINNLPPEAQDIMRQKLIQMEQQKYYNEYE